MSDQATYDKQPSPGKSRFEAVYQQVVKELEAGAVPWIMPWTREGSARPHNVVSKTRYVAFNSMLLSLVTGERGYESSGWMSPNQAERLGAQPKKGEKPHGAMKWFRSYTKVPVSAGRANNNRTGAAQQSGETYRLVYSRLPAMTTFPLYNLDQLTGLPDRFNRRLKQKPENNSVAGDFVKATAATIHNGAEKAAYRHTSDEIIMPYVGQFNNEENYFSTLLHELVHWTGHASRLGRLRSAEFGSQAYAEEELTAEMGAAFLCSSLGVKGELRHAGYIENWLQVLKDKPEALFYAASRAEAAVKYLEQLSSSEQ